MTRESSSQDHKEEAHTKSSSREANPLSLSLSLSLACNQPQIGTGLDPQMMICLVKMAL